MFVLILFGCKKPQEKIEKLVYDSKQIASLIKHTYEFNSAGKIKTDYSATYYYILGVPIDSAFSTVQFTYTATGKVASEFSLPDSSRRIRTYNKVDSLTGDFNINNFGDTSFLAVNTYQEGKLVKTVNRMLSSRFPENLEDVKKEDFRSYDTALFISELVYDNNTERSIFKDAKGNITGERVDSYKESRRVKSVVYSFIGSQKYVSQTINYNYENGADADFIAIGTQGDILSFQKTMFGEEGKVVSNYHGNMKVRDAWYYNKQD